MEYERFKSYIKTTKVLMRPYETSDETRPELSWSQDDTLEIGGMLEYEGSNILNYIPKQYFKDNYALESDSASSGDGSAGESPNKIDANLLLNTWTKEYFRCIGLEDTNDVKYAKYATSMADALIDLLVYKFGVYDKYKSK